MRPITTLVILALAIATQASPATAQTTSARTVDLRVEWLENSTEIQVHQRCAGMVSAVLVYGTVIAYNPAYGANPDAGHPFEWAMEQNPPHMPSEPNWSQAYLDAFGSVVIPTLVPNMAFYQRDKAICQDVFARD